MILLTPRCQFEAEGIGQECSFARGTFCERIDCAIESYEVILPCSVSAHEKRLRTLACCVSQTKPVTLHHTRGGSMSLSPFGSPGAGQKQNPALQIPLHLDYHVGQHGIDCRVGSSVEIWEARNRTQVEHLTHVSQILGYSVWSLAWKWASPLVRRRVETFLSESRSRTFIG